MDKWVMDKRLRYEFCMKDLHARVSFLSGAVTAAVKGREQEAEHCVSDGSSAGDNAAAPVSARILGLVLSPQSCSWKQWSSSRRGGPQPTAG